MKRCRGGRRPARPAATEIDRAGPDEGEQVAWSEVAEVATAERTVRAGDIVLVGRAASVQFAGAAGFVFRIVEVDLRPTYDGWVWLDGYQLDGEGRPALRRRIFVREAGLRRPRPRQA